MRKTVWLLNNNHNINKFVWTNYHKTFFKPFLSFVRIFFEVSAQNAAKVCIPRVITHFIHLKFILHREFLLVYDET